jgi:ubiquitin C-terminal hydrolase
MMLKDALENGNVDGSETEIEMTLLDYKDILDSLEKMLETCHVDDDVEIEIPAIQTVCNKSMMISCSPDVFCFHLNRKVYNPDSGRMKKLVTHVDFPIELNMSEFCAIENAANASNTSGKQLFHEGFLHSTTTKKHLIYELTAVILHQGNENGGHFTSFRRVSSENGNNFARGPYNSQWFHISDDRVRPVSLQDVLSSCAYMLFYERKTRRRQANLSGQFHMSNFTSMNEKKTL